MKSVAESHVHSTTNVATSTVSRDLYLLLAVIQVISVGSFRAVPMGQPRYGSSQTQNIYRPQPQPQMVAGQLSVDDLAPNAEHI
jgi:hypothetical protein